MIDKDTILSVHDKKITLLQWLETVEKAVADAVLSSITVTRPDSAHLVIKFTFADGTIISSDPLAIGSTDLDTVYNMLSAGSNITLTKDTGNNRVVIAFNSGSNVTVGTLTASAINCSGSVYVGQDGHLGVAGDASFSGLVEMHDDLAVDGAITCGSITENMSGYGFDEGSDGANYSNNVTYAGVVKTGNKITFVCAGNLVVTDTISANTLLAIGSYTGVPSTVGASIIPFGGGLGSQVAYQRLLMIASRTIKYEADMIFNKNSNTSFALQLNVSNALSAGTYFFRCEFTFLLSDSLA